jgi:hypothetical protein
MKLGAALKFHSQGVSLSEADHLVKQGVFGDYLDSATKAVVIGSLVTGIPLGIMAHMIAKKTKDVKGREKQLMAETQHYNEATRSLEEGLARSGAQI